MDIIGGVGSGEDSRTSEPASRREILGDGSTTRLARTTPLFVASGQRTWTFDGLPIGSSPSQTPARLRSPGAAIPDALHGVVGAAFLQHNMTSPTASEQRLYAANDRGGADRLEFHPSFGSASNALSSVAPGVYEGLRTFGRDRFFGLKTHIARLRDSVAGYKRPLAFDEESFVGALTGAVAEATQAFDAEARVRVDVTAEPASLLGTSSNVLLAVTPFRGLPENVVSNGAYLKTAPGLSRPDPAVKTSDFIALRQAWIAAHGDPDAYEHLMITGDGRLLEGTQANVAFVRDGVLIAAPSGVLPGVTQRAALDLARTLGIEVKMEFAALAELQSYDEAFMTTSVRNIVPISRIDDATFVNGGPVTKAISAAYESLTENDAALPADRASAKY